MILTIHEFVNLLTGVQEFYRTNNGYPTYTDELSASFNTLNTAILTSITANVDLKMPFENVMTQLVRAAEANYGQFPTNLTNNAEYLLGLLLHHDIAVSLGDNTCRISDAVLLLIENKHNLYGHRSMDLSPNFYRFSIPEWQTQQNYPTMDVLHQAWQHFEQQQTLAVQQQQQQPQNPQSNYDQQTWSLSDFSYFIEGFFMTNRIQLHTSTDNRPNIPKLPENASKLLSEFTQLSRNNDFHAYGSLVGLIQNLVTQAKRLNAASRQLIGFLLHHKFQLQHNLHQIDLNTLLQSEFGVQGLLTPQRPERIYPFLDPDWRIQQEYPSKADLETRVRLAQHMSQVPQQSSANTNAHIANPLQRIAPPPLLLRRDREIAGSRGVLQPILNTSAQNAAKPGQISLLDNVRL